MGLARPYVASRFNGLSPVATVSLAMRRSTLPFVVMLGLLFLVFGSVLPDPVGQYSTQMRNATNQFVTGLFPKQRPRLTPNERTERQLEEAENRQ